jgi:hypothetical protein
MIWHVLFNSLFIEDLEVKETISESVLVSMIIMNYGQPHQNNNSAFTQ